MSSTPILQIPFITESQTQPEVVANTAIQDLEAALEARLAVTMTDANLTLTDPDQACRYMAFVFTGTLTATRNIVVPARTKIYAIVNNTTGGHSVVVKTSGGTGVTIAVDATTYTLVYCDGTNVLPIGGSGGGAVSSVFTRTGAVVAVSGDYSEDEISFTDITTNNASTSKHGYLKKLPGDVTKFLDGTGAFSVPAGSGGGGGNGSIAVGWHGWSANPKTVSSPTGYGYVPADSVNNSGVASVALPTATIPVTWKLTTTATATSWHEFGDTDVAGITLGTLGELSAQALLGATSGIRMWLGLATDGGIGSIFSNDTPTGEPMAMFRYSSNASDVNFQCVCGSGSGVPVVVDSGVTADTALHVFRITYDAITPAVKFWIDGNLVATVTTNLPSNSQKMCSFIHVDNVGAAADKFVQIAYIIWTQLPVGSTVDSDALATLTDVNLTSPTDGQVLTYESGSAKWVNQTPSGGGGSVASGTSLMAMGNQAPTSLGDLGAATTLWLKIPGRSLNCIPATWKIRIRRTSGAHFAAIVILRTAIDSLTVLDSTPVTFGGSPTPTMSSGLNTSDAISLALDNTHDYWIAGYNDSGNFEFWGIKPSVADNTATLGLVGGYQTGDGTTTSPIPLGSFSTGFGEPWDAVFAA